MRLPLNVDRYCLAACAACLVWSVSVLAAEPPQPSADAIALDERIQVLKDDALELNRAVQKLEDDYAYPPETAVSVFVGVNDSTVFLKQVTLVIDNQEPVLYSYSEREARALLKKGLHRVLRVNVDPGTHRIAVDFVARKYGDEKNPVPANLPDLVGHSEAVFQKAGSEVELLANYAPSSKTTPFPAYKPGSKDDPRVRAADFLNGDERHFGAALTLLQLRKAQEREGKLPDDYLWRLADSYLAFGMRSKAEAIYRELSNSTKDQATLSRSRIKLAQFQYERGFLLESTNSLMRLRDKLPDSVVLTWQDLLSRSLMAQGRYGDAAEVLTEMKNGDKQSPYTRYNLAVAMINGGDAREGETILDKLGRMTVTDAETAALKDKANLTLGYHFLRRNEGSTATPVFARVRINGPYSNRALLGMGWAELAPRGTRQKKTEIRDEPEEVNPLASLATLGILINPARLQTDPFAKAGVRSFKLKRQSTEEEATLRRALVPWAELINRDPMDPAVQEGMLAIPFALDRIGAHQSAQEFYEKAATLLEESRSRIDDASLHIKEARMVETIVRRDIDSEAGWSWRLRDLPDAPETFYLQSIIAQNRYQEALKNYRDVRFLGRNLDGVKQRLDTLDSLYNSSAPKTVAPEVLIERARLGIKPVKEKLSLRLKVDQQLTAPFASPAAAEPPLLINLRLSEVPSKFNGPREASIELRNALEALRPRIAAVGGAQSEVLRAIALDELDDQKKLFEKYLVEARFSLARIYEGRVKDAGLAAAEKERADAKKEARKGLFARLFSRKKADDASNKAAKDAAK